MGVERDDAVSRPLLPAIVLAVVVVNDITTEESSYIVDTVDTMDHLTAGVLLAGTGNDPRWDDDEPPSVEDAVGPLQRDLHIAFVDSAYDQLNWGRRVGLGGGRRPRP